MIPQNTSVSPKNCISWEECNRRNGVRILQRMHPANEQSMRPELSTHKADHFLRCVGLARGELSVRGLGIGGNEQIYHVVTLNVREAASRKCNCNLCRRLGIWFSKTNRQFLICELTKSFVQAFFPCRLYQLLEICLHEQKNMTSSVTIKLARLGVVFSSVIGHFSCGWFAHEQTPWSCFFHREWETLQHNQRWARRMSQKTDHGGSANTCFISVHSWLMSDEWQCSKKQNKMHLAVHVHLDRFRQNNVTCLTLIGCHPASVIIITCCMVKLHDSSIAECCKFSDPWPGWVWLMGNGPRAKGWPISQKHTPPGKKTMCISVTCSWI